MNLFYTSDDNFVPQLGAGICSVCENNQNAQEICFYIGSLGITNDHQLELIQLAHRYGRRVVFLEIGNLRELIGFDFDTSGWNPIVLARLAVDRLLPQSVERVIYLDGDTIVRGSLKELWETDLEGCAIGASMEPTANRKRRVALGLAELPYFNAGVLLIDLKRWREEGTGARILGFYQAKQGQLFANDQDAINGALAGEIYVLSPKYNYFNIYWYYPYRVLCKLAAPAPYLSRAELKDAQRQPTIIHYLGEDRPWRRGNTHRYSADYQHYLSLTPWADTPMEEGWQTYFVCYKLFLTLLKPLPMLRYHIIDSLIPLFLRYRKRQRLKEKK
jgi:lipopolysaccharide biosynthesis glycosyltransferase